MFKSLMAAVAAFTVVVLVLLTPVAALAGYQEQTVTVENSYGAFIANKTLDVFRSEVNVARNEGHNISFEIEHIIRVGAESYDFHVWGNLPTYNGGQTADYNEAWYIINISTDHHGHDRVTGWRQN